MVKYSPETYLRMARNILLLKEFDCVANLAQRNNIKLIALKGIANLKNLYPDLAQRDLGDIDILVHHQDLIKIVELLKQEGYCLENDNFDPQKPYSDYLNSIVLRKESKSPYFLHLHWHLKNTSLPLSMFKIDMDKVFNQANLVESEDSTFYLLNAEHNFLYSCLHAFVHSYDRESFVEEILLFVSKNKDSLDSERIVSIAKKWNLVTPLYCALQLIKGIPLNISKDELSIILGLKTKNLCDQFCAQVLSQGASQNLVMPIYLSMFSSPWQKIKFIWRTQFPTLKIMKRIYNKEKLSELVPYYFKRIDNSRIQLKEIVHKSIFSSDFNPFFPHLIKHKILMIKMLFFVYLAMFSSLAIPFAVKATVESYITNEAASAVVYSSIIASLLYLISVFFQSIAHFYRRNLKINLRNDISNNLFENYLNMDLNSSFTQGAGSKSYELMQDSERVADSLISLISEFCLIFPKSIFIVALLLVFDVFSAFFVLLVFLLTTLIIRALSKKLKNSYAEILYKEQNLSNYLHDLFENLFLVKVFYNESYEKQRYSNLTASYVNYSKKNVYLETIHNFFSSSSGRITLVALLVTSLYRIQIGQLSAGNFSAAFVYLVQLALMLSSFLMLQHKFALGQQACGRLRLINRSESTANSSGEKQSFSADGAKCIVISELSFAFEDKRLFKNFSTEIAEGWTAIIGPSGSGKSTLLNLILELYKPSAGEISLPLNTINNLLLTRRIVPQDVRLWNDTVLNNIVYGSNGITVEDALYAAKLADADAFIKELEKSYSTVIAPEASNLSEGQKQKICLARALVSKPEILLIDEAFSSLDEESEKKIIKNLKNQSWLKYVIVVSHRQSTISHCDTVIAL